MASCSRQSSQSVSRLAPLAPSLTPRLDIPKTQTPLISRVAPLSRAARAKKDAARELQKNTWGIRKQIFRELREKRRTFW